MLDEHQAEARPKPGRINAEQARELIENHDAMLIDVRSPAEYRSGHIDGATNVPLQLLSARARALAEQERPIVVYCRSGNRSDTARQILGAKGLAEVYDLGAMSNW